MTQVIHWGRVYAGCPTDKPHESDAPCFRATHAFAIEADGAYQDGVAIAKKAIEGAFGKKEVGANE